MNYLSTKRLLHPLVVQDRTSLSRTTIWRLIRQGNFPQPIRITNRRIAWYEAAVSVWIAAKMDGGTR
jgi:prophage regulatory protein